MAAQYTPISLKEMETFLTRSFRAYKPVKDTSRGEVVFDLKLSDKVGVRVYSSIMIQTSGGAGVGEDAIRVQLISLAQNRPLKSGKAPRVYRTQGWKDNLTDRIEDEVESFHDRESYWESRA